MQRSSIASRMRALAGSPITPVLSALAVAGVGCGRQQPAPQAAPDQQPALPAEAQDAGVDELDALFREASPDVIAAHLEQMLDASAPDASPYEASAPQPKHTATPQPPPRDPTPRPIYRGVDV